MKHIWAKSRLECAELMCVYVCVWAQALEEATADAAEEEKRRLQTQTELQDRYRMDLEREKLVRLCHVQQQRSVLRHFLFPCVCVLVFTVTLVDRGQHCSQKNLFLINR